MGKIAFIGLLLIFATMMVGTTAFVFPPPKTSFDSSEEGIDDGSINDKERMLCNVIVRATYDLHIYQKKSANEISIYLDGDCKKLADEKLIEQCHEMVTEYGAKIYEHVKNGTICQKIDDYSEIDLDHNDNDDDDEKIDCSSKSKDKCQCCRMHVERRKMRLRHIVKHIARKRLHMCKHSRRPHLCRYWIREKERRVLKKIGNICPHAVCKHLGYCKKTAENNDVNGVLEKSKIDFTVDSPSLLLELLLDVQLDTYFTKNICNEFEQLQTICIHISASVDSRRYAKTYIAMLQNDTTRIEKYFKKEETVYKTLMDTCGHHSSKENCQEMFNKQFNTMNNYLHSMKADEFCAVNHHCSSNMEEKCTACVQRFQPRKDAARKVIDRLTSYLPSLCTKSNVTQCLQFVAGVTADIRFLMDEFDVKNTCQTMGFCEQNAAYHLDDYDQAYINIMNKEICPMLGPFQKLCQQIVQGDSIKMETISFSTASIQDFFARCEDNGNETNTKTVTIDQCSEDNNKCQCCIKHVIQKKKCMKKRVAKYVEHMKELCKRCPAREKCERHWDEKKIRWDVKIDKICPRMVCTHMGYCDGIHLFGRIGEHPKMVPFVDKIIDVKM
ncbi:hypothetical protein I4U23_023073 [Adineta vaga]|nr:hypothetical protein I4U23_023073 [Adineta vaga]